ncbi:MAG: CUAEP/CCAEP-tail radical SAM (seleno)protein [Egibacteraceae bacterium]
MNTCLISTYEMGRQPFGLASPAALLRSSGHAVACFDLAVAPLDEDVVAAADLIAFYVPMHTATRIAVSLVQRIRGFNSQAHICFYGLYAPLNEAYLRRVGVGTILGGEYEEGLLALVKRLSRGPGGRTQGEPVISLARQRFRTPDRSGLPDLAEYARLIVGPGDERIVGYTEATRGCKHLCRHCPIVPVYQGRFRVVQQGVVLDDIAQQVEAGASHITFGDPDFFNAPRHSITLVDELHQRFPDVTYDVTIKVEHLLKHADYVGVLRDTGCLFVTSAVESFDDRILEIFDKGHTRQETLRVLALFRDVGLTLVPTFVAFTPWTTLGGYCDFLSDILTFELVGNVAPVQYAIQLLIPAGSKLLELDATQQVISDFDEEALCYPWAHPDSRMDRLQAEMMRVVKDAQRKKETRERVFARIWETAQSAYGDAKEQLCRLTSPSAAPACVTIPYMTEPWFC